MDRKTGEEIKKAFELALRAFYTSIDESIRQTEKDAEKEASRSIGAEAVAAQKAAQSSAPARIFPDPAPSRAPVEVAVRAPAPVMAPPPGVSKPFADMARVPVKTKNVEIRVEPPAKPAKNFDKLL